jgi:hypothetical protein
MTAGIADHGLARAHPPPRRPAWLMPVTAAIGTAAAAAMAGVLP